jgi:hypothetical protein
MAQEKPYRHAFPAARIGVMIAAAIARGGVPSAESSAYPQTDTTVTLPPHDAHRLAGYFTPPYPSGPIPPAVASALEAGAPPQANRECAALASGWSSDAGRTAHVSVKVLGISGTGVWIAYRCASASPQLERYYSDRVAILTAGRKSIRFIGVGAPHDSPRTLYHAGFDKAIKLEGATAAAAFLIYANADAGRIAGAEDRYVLIADRAAGARAVLALTIERHAGGVGRMWGDEGDDYHATLRFDHTVAGNVTAVTAYFREVAAGGASRPGMARCRWNPVVFSFEQMTSAVLPPSAPSSGPGTSKVLPPVPSNRLAH